MTISWDVELELAQYRLEDYQSEFVSLVRELEILKGLHDNVDYKEEEKEALLAIISDRYNAAKKLEQEIFAHTQLIEVYTRYAEPTETEMVPSTKATVH